MHQSARSLRLSWKGRKPTKVCYGGELFLTLKNWLSQYHQATRTSKKFERNQTAHTDRNLQRVFLYPESKFS